MPIAARLPMGLPICTIEPSRPRLLGRRVLDHHQHGATPFAAEADALQEAQRDEEDRRGDADLLIGRQQLR